MRLELRRRWRLRCWWLRRCWEKADKQIDDQQMPIVDYGSDSWFQVQLLSIGVIAVIVPAGHSSHSSHPIYFVMSMTERKPICSLPTFLLLNLTTDTKTQTQSMHIMEAWLCWLLSHISVIAWWTPLNLRSKALTYSDSCKTYRCLYLNLELANAIIVIERPVQDEDAFDWIRQYEWVILVSTLLCKKMAKHETDCKWWNWMRKGQENGSPTE